MREFKYLDYWTEYACKGIIQRQMQGSACFMEIFNSFSNRDIINEQYKIKVYKGVEKVNEHKSNACFLEPLQIKNHLKQIKSLFPFKFHIRLYRNYYIIYLKLHNQPGIYHKYLLTWLRYIYEFPYNVLLLDALKLKKKNVLDLHLYQIYLI